MKIALGKFACSEIRAHLDGDIETTVREALNYYAGRIKSGRALIGLPHFCRAQTDVGNIEVTFDLTLHPECEALLESDAARQRTSVEALARHAVLLYLAELDLQSAT